MYTIYTLDLMSLKMSIYCTKNNYSQTCVKQPPKGNVAALGKWLCNEVEYQYKLQVWEHGLLNRGDS